MSTRQQPTKSKPRRKTKRSDPNTTVKTVVVPFAKTQVITTKVPKGGSVRAKPRTQHILSVINSGPFSVNNGLTTQGLFRLNPSNQALFPSLAFEAANYDMYRFKRLALRYSQLATTQTTGRIALMWDPDSQDTPPSSRVQISEYSRSVSTAVYEECRMVIPTDNKWRFVNDSDVADRKLVDHGQVFVVVHSGSNSTFEVGDVYLEYDVEFKDPQPTASMVQTGNIDSTTFVSSGPRYLNSPDVAFGNISGSLRFNIAGTFCLNVVCTAAAGGSLAVGGNSTLVGTARGGYGSGNFLASLVFNCTGVPNATPSITISGLTDHTRMQFFVTRCNVANALVVG